MSSSVSIERLDNYTIKVNGKLITANQSQEDKIRAMTPEQVNNFLKIFYPDLTS